MTRDPEWHESMNRDFGMAREQAAAADGSRGTGSPHRTKGNDMQITQEIAAKVLTIVDKGLSSGLGVRRPGEFCVEAAVCYALDLPHGDDPGCVAPALRSLKIALNDRNWSSRAARAKGLRRLAVAQLGSKGHLDEAEFRTRIVDLAFRKSVPAALRSAAAICKDEKHKAALCEAANRCERDGTQQAVIDARAVAKAADADADAAADAAAAAYAAADADADADAVADAAADADAAAYAAADAAADARDKSLADYAEAVVQILIDMKAPGCEWLPLTEVA
jgi:hypothetical protein